MDEQEYRAREVELRERQLAFEREKFLTEQERDVKPRRGLAGVFTAGALTALTPMAGVFLDLQQADRQEFEGRLNNLRDGYDFYFGLRETLKASGDAGDLEAVVRTMSTAFPEAYCGVRPDLHRLALTRGASEEENAALVGSILGLSEVTPLDASGGSLVARWAPWRKLGERRIVCDPIALVETMAPMPEGAPVERAKPLEAEVGVGAKALQGEGAPAEAAAAAASAAAAAFPTLAPATRGYMVYLHADVRVSADVLGPERPFLSERGFALAPGVAPMPFPVTKALVRFYQKDQQADAEALARWLSERFAAQGVVFQAKVSRLPLPPRDILEVWLPRSLGPAETSSPARK
jgi:hypothetical protein